MQQTRFIVLVLVSGALSGLTLGAANIVLVEPYLDVAIMDEARAGLEPSDGPQVDMFWAEHEDYRQLQKGGAVIAAMVLGTAASALYGLVYLLYSKSLPGATHTARIRILAVSMWVALHVVPFVKYPPSLPGGSGADTLEIRTTWFLTLVVISGVGAILLHRASLSMPGKRKAVPAIAWVAMISLCIVVMPANPETAQNPPEILDAFRAASFASVAIYWTSFALILGALWAKLGADPASARYGDASQTV